MLKKKKKYTVYVSKGNSYREKQVVLLMIPNGKGRKQSETLATWTKYKGQRRWHYLAVKKLSELLRGITFRWFLLPELPSFLWNKKKLESHKKVWENKDFCNVITSSENTKMLEFNQYQKSDKAPFSISEDFEYNRKDW